MMKTTLLILIVFMVSGSFSQEEIIHKPSHIFTVANTYNLQFIGDKSEKIVSVLFEKFPQVKRKKYIWKFKNVQVPGFEEALSFQVYQGVFGVDTTESIPEDQCSKHYYFLTFQNDMQKELRLAKNIPSEQIAISIYIKKAKKEPLKTRNEAVLVESYLNNL